jgi:predicted  nucleic acid-binding Zn-ribbon protein
MNKEEVQQRVLQDGELQQLQKQIDELDKVVDNLLKEKEKLEYKCETYLMALEEIKVCVSDALNQIN